MSTAEANAHFAPWGKRLLLVVLLLVQAGLNHAQLLDSIGLFLQEPPEVVVRLDVRGSFISNSNVRFLGAKVGLQHAERFQYGIGYSFLFTPVEHNVVIDGVSRTTNLRLGYVTPYVDYAFYQRGPWEMRLPVQLGFGAGSVKYKDDNGKRQTLSRSGVIFYEPAMTVQYRFWKYFGVTGGWGFRLALNTRNDLNEHLTAPIYILGFKIFFEDIWRDSQQSEE